MRDIRTAAARTVSLGRRKRSAQKPYWRDGAWAIGSTLTIVINLGADPVPFKTPSGRLLFSTGDTDPMTAAYLEVCGMSDDIVRDLARRAGIAVEWQDLLDNRMSWHRLSCAGFWPPSHFRPTLAANCPQAGAC